MNLTTDTNRNPQHSTSPMDVISKRAFNRLREIVYKESGISLGDQKRIMLSTRIAKRLRATGHKTYEEYIEYISNPLLSGNELILMIDAVTTNKTDFFREDHHFQFMTDILLPRLKTFRSFSRDNPLRVWSAGCSSGEEPYTIAFVLSEFFGGKLELFHITATDLSTKVLNKAVRAIYSNDSVRDVPTNTRLKYMMRGAGDWADFWRVRPEIRRRVTFGRLNFIDDNYGFNERFDIIFHRNVMIYFDRETRASIVAKLSRNLVDEGYLFIGHSETLHQISEDFKLEAKTIYKKKPQKS